MGFLTFGCNLQFVTSEVSYRQQPQPTGVVICTVCGSPFKELHAAHQTRLPSVFVSYLTRPWLIFLQWSSPHCSCPSIDFRGMVLQLFKQMQKDVCEVKCHGIIGCADNLTVRNTYKWLYLVAKVCFTAVRSRCRVLAAEARAKPSPPWVTRLPRISGAQGASMQRQRAGFSIFAYAGAEE